MTIGFLGGFGEAPRIITKYMALFENIIHKLRAPKFMQIVSEELGNDVRICMIYFLLEFLVCWSCSFRRHYVDVKIDYMGN